MILVAIGCAVASGVGGYRWWAARQPSHRFERGLQALAEDDLRRLKREAEALEGAAGHEHRAALLRGALLVRLNRHAGALESLEAARDHPETRARGLALMGEALYKLGRYREAELVLQQALGDDPKQADAHCLLAATYFDTGANRHALRHLRRLVELTPRDARPHFMMATIHQTAEDYRAAIREFRETLRLNPQHPDREFILLELARAFIKLFEYGPALEVLSESAESSDALALKAECHYGEGRTTEARSLLDRALRLSPRHPPALLLQGTIDLEAGHAEQALRSLSRAAEAPAGESPPELTHAARFMLAQAYRRLGQHERAEEQMRLLHAHQRLWERFNDLHREAAERPHDPRVRRELSALAEQLKRPELARMWSRAASAMESQQAASAAP